MKHTSNNETYSLFENIKGNKLGDPRQTWKDTSEINLKKIEYKDVTGFNWLSYEKCVQTKS
jgi:hypothetical protein